MGNLLRASEMKYVQKYVQKCFAILLAAMVVMNLEVYLSLSVTTYLL